MMNRIINEALFIIDKNATIRKTAQEFHISKSLVHKDIHSKLKKKDVYLYDKVIQILNEHNQKKHILGGIATKRKYQRGGL